MKIAVTGANGFVGRHVVAALCGRGHEAIGLVRSDEASRVVQGAGGEAYRIHELGGEALVAALKGVEAVVHTAQIGAERGNATYEAVNVAATRAVAAAARQAGVGRVVFLSGLGVAHYGMARRTTNRYFLSKLAAELALFRSGLEVGVLRPSYVLGPGGSFLPSLLADIRRGEVEVPGVGAYRLQPVAVDDACAAVLALVERGLSLGPTVIELVGPERVTFLGFLGRLSIHADVAPGAPPFRVRPISIEEADRQAAAGGYRGMAPDELDCLLCDEVGDHAPLERLLGRPLLGLDAAIEAAVRA